MDDFYWGAETSQEFEIRDSDGIIYIIPEGYTLYAIIKETKFPNATELLKKDITSDQILRLYYADFANLKINKSYWLELTLVKPSGEYISPLTQLQFNVIGVEYGR